MDLGVRGGRVTEAGLARTSSAGARREDSHGEEGGRSQDRRSPWFRAPSELRNRGLSGWGNEAQAGRGRGRSGGASGLAPVLLFHQGTFPGWGGARQPGGCCAADLNPPLWVPCLPPPPCPVEWKGGGPGSQHCVQISPPPLGSAEALAGPVPSLAPFCSSVKWAAEGTTWGAGGGFSCDQSPGNRCAQVPGSFCSVSFPHVWTWKWVTTARCCRAESGVKAGSWPRTFWVWRGQPGHLSPSVLDKPARC